MAKVEIAKPRFAISEELGSLRIVIPTRPKWAVVIFLGLFLSVWVFAIGVGILSAQRSGDSGSVTIFGFFVLLGVGTALTWLWAVASREVIVIDETLLTVRRELLAVGRSKQFDLGQIRNLRVSQLPAQAWYGFGTDAGGFSVAFDYGVRTYRFGAAVSSSFVPGLSHSLDEAEANHLVEVIKQRFPRLVAS